MTLKETTLPFLAQDCRQAFGPTEGDTLYQQTEARFQALLAQADDRGSPAIRDHLARKLLPPLAFYQTLRARGMDQAAALDLVRQETRQAAQEKKAEMASLARLPFAYTWYRLGVKKHMAKHFPPEGWETQWVRCDGKEIHFNLRIAVKPSPRPWAARNCAPCTARMTTSPSPAWPLRSPSAEPAPWPAGPSAATFIFSRSEDSMQYLRTKKAVATANPTERK